MTIDIDVQYASQALELPTEERIRDWVRAALAGRRGEAELVVRLVDDEEGLALNRDYRDRGYATNVLSFPFDAPPGLELPILGDLVVCAPVVLREAAEQGKRAEAHFAHMIVHGTLHLLGYDHEGDADAELMESLERDILGGLGFPDPYMAV